MTPDDTKRLIDALDAEYDPEEGFLGLLREGHFDSRAFDRFISLLKSIDFGTGRLIDRRVVALLWMAPMFIDWQERRFDPEDRMAVQSAANRVLSEVERILGVP